MKHSSSLKCPQCGLVNFATVDSCKRCGNALVASTADAEPLNRRNWPVFVGIGGFLLLCTLVIGGYAIVRTVNSKREVARNAEIARAAKDHNREAARNALNAIGELQSVTSVGTNFMQYTSALQTAKIKFDAALRNYAPNDTEDREVAKQLIEAFECHVDARDAWSEFIEHGSYGFVDEKNLVVKPLAQKYGLEAEASSFSSERHFFNRTVLDAIWSKANSDFQLLGIKLAK
jgi:hypothetical protein